MHNASKGNEIPPDEISHSDTHIVIFSLKDNHTFYENRQRSRESADV
jgi:hypothetical protein